MQFRIIFFVTVRCPIDTVPRPCYHNPKCQERDTFMYQITDWCRHFIRMHVTPGDFCIDATMGNGHDTELLCQLVGKEGHVLAFDIQNTALLQTQKRLQASGVPDNYRLILDSHSHMKQYADTETVSCITFNLGYLPGGDHALATRADTSLEAVRQSLALLKKGGLLSLCIYSGGDTGFEERDTLLPFLKELDPKAYLVILSSYYNRPNHPPLPVLVKKQL